MEDNYLALLIESEAKKAENCLLTALNQSQLFDVCYARKCRVKTKEHLLEKKTRKVEKENKVNYKIEDITDVIGIRLVTLFRNEMSIVFENIINLINHDNPLNPNPFEKCAIDEIIIYIASLVDPVTLEIGEIAENKKLSIIPEIKESKEGYSSIHIVTKLKHKCSEINKKIKSYKIPLEIQIRTVFEDAWGEIDHKYGYSNRRSVDSDEQILKKISNHLRILKKFSDACADYANQIHIEYTNKKLEISSTEKVLSVNSDDDIINIFRREDVQNDKIELYILARDKRVQHERQTGEEREDGLSLASNDFNLIVSDLEIENLSFENDRGVYLFYFYCKMNEAICLMSTKNTQNINKSLNIYLTLFPAYEKFPLLLMRTGQAYGKLQKNTKATDYYKKTFNLIKEYEEKGLKGSDVIPTTDYNHIKSNLPALLGYELWKSSRDIDCSSDEGLIQSIYIIKNAYETTITRKDFVEEENKYRMYNNLLYYAYDICHKIDGIKNITPEIRSLNDFFSDKVKGHLNDIEGLISVDEIVDLNALDTIAKAYFFFKNYPKARKIGNRIVDLIVLPPDGRQIEASLKDEIHEETWIMLKSIDNMTD
ncbi:MAG: hypothetical protein PHP53_24545 [Prolixibacteraceae bacterium]|nr:hypothetical protein [Prolixibacteraceae bacterium]